MCISYRLASGKSLASVRSSSLTPRARRRSDVSKRLPRVRSCRHFRSRFDARRLGFEQVRSTLFSFLCHKVHCCDFRFRLTYVRSVRDHTSAVECASVSSTTADIASVSHNGWRLITCSDSFLSNRLTRQLSSFQTPEVSSCSTPSTPASAHAHDADNW